MDNLLKQTKKTIVEVIKIYIGLFVLIKNWAHLVFDQAKKYLKKLKSKINFASQIGKFKKLYTKKHKALLKKLHAKTKVNPNFYLINVYKTAKKTYIQKTHFSYKASKGAFLGKLKIKKQKTPKLYKLLKKYISRTVNSTKVVLKKFLKRLYKKITKLLKRLYKRKKAQLNKLIKRLGKKINYIIKYIINYITRFVKRRYKIAKKSLINYFSPLFKKTVRKSLVFKATILNSLLFLTLIFTTLFYYQIIYTLPNVLTIKNYRPKLTTYIYDKNEDLLYKTYLDENRTLVNLNDVPKHTINALIAIEDQNFYKHLGISPPSILRAAYANYKQKETVQGGSTITQQLVKNIVLSPEKTYERKIKEALLAFLVEQKYSKDEILQMYLNTVSFGSTAYGIEEASLMYFGKHAKDLSLEESAMLAGLPAAPSRYTPYVSIDATKKRQQAVLANMVNQGYINVSTAVEAYEKPLNIKYPESVKKYPHFVNYVYAYLAQKYPEQYIQNGGLNVYTSLDTKLQDFAQQVVSNEITNLQRLNISNGAALITKNKTGEVLAMVGSKDFYAEDIDGFVNITTSLRQPGSSIKPFNYSLSFNNGWSPATIIVDEKVVYNTPGSPPYIPKNYDNKFRGRVTVRQALANSLNIPSVKTLEKNGVDNFVNYVQKFGIDTWNSDYYGLSLALGAAEVKMVDMNQAYATFANNGVTVKTNPILYITTANGDVLEYNPCIYSKDDFKDVKIINQMGNCGEKIISSGNAYLIKSILSDFKARVMAFGTNSVLNVKGTAAKTGTTNNMRDNWAFGFNEEYTVGTWVGNNDNTPMSYVASGVTGASPIWAKIISNITNEKNYLNTSDVPSDVVQVNICPLTGTKSCSACSGFAEYFLRGTEPTKSCSNKQIEEILKRQQEKDKKDNDDDDD